MAGFRPTKRHDRMLCEITSLPTAAGCEQRVFERVRQVVSDTPGLQIKADRFGNMLIRTSARASRTPIVFVAHMDHPAFVVTHAARTGTVTADFRGGVGKSYFVGSKVRCSRGGVGTIDKVTVPRKRASATSPGRDLRCTITWQQDSPPPAVGDVLIWDLSETTIDMHGIVSARACDNLASVAAGLVMIEHLARLPRPEQHDVRLLLTRCEEIGFVGASGVCASGLIPKQSRVVVLENSKAQGESPIGGGPIVRVGDRTSVFDSTLTAWLTATAQRLGKKQRNFTFMRRLMPGGSCEATAFALHGYQAGCLCLSLGNYHNMNESTGTIDSEQIAIADWRNLVRLLVGLAEDGHHVDTPTHTVAARIEQIFHTRRHLLEQP